jgi:hypothetical protein
MNIENFSDANKQLIEYKPLFNKIVKSADVFDLEKSNFSKKIVNNESVLLICDFEGSIVFLDETFRNQTCLNNLIDNSILDFLHQEDIPIVIEQLVHLLQGKSDSIIIESRIIHSENQNFYSKWHVGYLRGLFYFYPIELPKYLKNISENQKHTAQNFKSQKSLLPEQLLWKIEVSKTLYEWDALIFKQIKSCTNI